MLEKDAYLFPVKDSKMYNQTRGFDNQGSAYFKAPNPDFGATFTYFVKEVPKTAKAIRQEKEKALFEKENQYRNHQFLKSRQRIRR